MASTAREEDEFELLNKELEGQIQILDVAGVGGFSVVYRGWHSRFEGPVAVKCLKIPPSLSTEGYREYLEKFRSEAKILFKLQRLSHNIVHVYSAGEFEFGGQPVPYIVLGWLDGTDLEYWLNAHLQQGRGPLALPEAVNLLDCAAEALSKAHAAGITHRDLKPSNLWVTTDGEYTRLKLLDFGIAKVIAPSAAPGNPTATHVTLRAYTRRYAAPEQRDSTLGATGPATDVFSLALVAVELLTGTPALCDDDHGSFYEARREDVRPTPRSKGARIPEEVEAVFRRALAVHSAERYSNATEFWLALCAAARLPSPEWLGRRPTPVAGLTPVPGRTPVPPTTEMFTPAPVYGAPAMPVPTVPTAPSVPTGPLFTAPEIPPAPPLTRKPKRSAWPLAIGAAASLIAVGYWVSARPQKGPDRPLSSSSPASVTSAPAATAAVSAPSITLPAAPAAATSALAATSAPAAPSGSVGSARTTAPTSAQPPAPVSAAKRPPARSAGPASIGPCGVPNCDDAPPSQFMRPPD